jgi:hypothetical protein
MTLAEVPANCAGNVVLRRSAIAQQISGYEALELRQTERKEAL